MPRAKGKTVGILLEQLYEDNEFWYPYFRLKEAGYEVKVIAPEAKEYPSKHGLMATADTAVTGVRADELAGLIIPGGYSPDHMRRSKHMVDLVWKIFEQGKPLAAICHGGWMLASACVVKGKTVTSFFSIKDDLINAGAKWVDQPSVVDKNVITSRFPADLPEFMKAVLKALGGG